MSILSVLFSSNLGKASWKRQGTKLANERGSRRWPSVIALVSTLGKVAKHQRHLPAALFLLCLVPFLPFEILERESLHLSLFMFVFPKHLL